jgi:hypothetical protein
MAGRTRAGGGRGARARFGAPAAHRSLLPSRRRAWRASCAPRRAVPGRGQALLEPVHGRARGELGGLGSTVPAAWGVPAVDGGPAPPSRSGGPSLGADWPPRETYGSTLPAPSRQAPHCRQGSLAPSGVPKPPNWARHRMATPRSRRAAPRHRARPGGRAPTPKGPEPREIDRGAVQRVLCDMAAPRCKEPSSFCWVCTSTPVRGPEG